tara:strand:+ start:253 stop:513 length:261 start_codon:yes stop_codon:yes gene_type:complete
LPLDVPLDANGIRNELVPNLLLAVAAPVLLEPKGFVAFVSFLLRPVTGASAVLSGIGGVGLGSGNGGGDGGFGKIHIKFDPLILVH